MFYRKTFTVWTGLKTNTGLLLSREKNDLNAITNYDRNRKLHDIVRLQNIASVLLQYNRASAFASRKFGEKQ